MQKTPEQPTLIYLDIDENGNIIDMLRGNYAVPNKEYDIFVATYDQSLIDVDASQMKLHFDNSGLVTKVTITVDEG